MKYILSILLTFMIGSAAIAQPNGLIWSGDFETGNFRQYHMIWGIPEYCRPPGGPNGHGLNPVTNPGNWGGRNWGDGDGSCLEMETQNVRQGRFAAKFTIKNQANSQEPRDCDSNGNQCQRRRSEIWVDARGQYVGEFNEFQERWISVSVFLPTSFDVVDPGVIVFQMKPYRVWSGISPALSITPSVTDGWQIHHRWSDVANLNNTFDPAKANNNPKPSVQTNFQDARAAGRAGNYLYSRKTIDQGPSTLHPDFPNLQASRAALNNLNLGGWTDFIIRIRSDSRITGTGFIRIWMRADRPGQYSDNWVEVVHVKPKNTSQIKHGIMFPDQHFPVGTGLYGAPKPGVMGARSNTSIIIDNLKIARETATFAQMVPEAGGANIVDPDPGSPIPVLPPPSGLTISGRLLTWAHPGADGFVISSPNGSTVSVPGSSRAIQLSRMRLGQGATTIYVRAVSGTQVAVSSIQLTVGTAPQPSQVCAVIGPQNKVTWEYTAGTDSLRGFDVLLDGTLLGQTGATARELSVPAFLAGSRTVTVRARTTTRDVQTREVSWTHPGGSTPETHCN